MPLNPLIKTLQEGGTAYLNKKGQWVPAIPEPYFCLLFGMDCACGKHFYRRESYEAHYALKHILNL